MDNTKLKAKKPRIKKSYSNSNIFQKLMVDDVRSKILFTVLCLLVYRLGCGVTIPFVNTTALTAMFGSTSVLDYYNLVSGGALSQCAVFAIGVSAYMQSIEKEQSLRHREVFSGGHNAVRSKKQTDALLNEDVSKLSNADIEKVLTFIRTNAKTFRQKLRKLYITQQKKQIDVKKTIEKSVQCDGEIARLYYKKPIKSKANVVMLADISGSCRAMTSLALTYMGLMREVFPGGCHLFVFVNHLVPVDRYFSNENVTSAVESINKSVPSRGIYSNYGVPLKELRYDNTGIINKDTTIVMLGDCRNNKNYSGVEEVEWLSKRASNFFVLNPDPLNKWGQGDSIADLYAKSGATVCRVSSTQDLLTFLESASLKNRT